MAECTKISDPPVVFGGPRRRMPTAWKATVLAAPLLVGGSIEALAADPPVPEADRVWGGCKLDFAAGGTVERLIADIEANSSSKINAAEVSFIVVYTNANPNNGQPLTAGGFTGPVICRNPVVVTPVPNTDPAAVNITAFDKNGEPSSPPPPSNPNLNRLRETTDIPVETHPTGAADDIDINSAEEEFLLQYTVNKFGGPLDGTRENRVCHTTDANVDCFRIFAPPPPVIP